MARRAPGRAELGREVVFRYLAPAGRLHLRAVLTAATDPARAGPALPIAGPLLLV